MLARFSLKNKVIVLTGGAGLYGNGLSSDLASSGANLVIASRNLESCERVAANIRSAGYFASAERVDQGDEDSIRNLKDTVLRKFGRIDGLVNNAVSRPMTTAGASLDQWEASMKINATGLFLMHRYFGEVMSEQKGGSIVNIGSIQGMLGPTLSLYAGTEMACPPPPDYYFHKGGMVNLTRYFAAVLGASAVRVNCLSPGGFLHQQDPIFVKRYSEQTFLGRMGNETDLGGSVVFLLSDASLYLTGVNIPVDGGYTSK